MPQASEPSGPQGPEEPGAFEVRKARHLVSPLWGPPERRGWSKGNTRRGGFKGRCETLILLQSSPESGQEVLICLQGPHWGWRGGSRLVAICKPARGGARRQSPAPVALEPLPGPTHNRPQQVLMAVWGCWAKGCWGAEYPLRFFSADTPHPTPTGPGKTLHFVTPPCTKATFLLSLGEFLASPQLPLSPLSSSCLRGPDRTPPPNLPRP